MRTARFLESQVNKPFCAPRGGRSCSKAAVRTRLLTLVGLFLAANAIGCAHNQAQPRKLNILYIMTDQQPVSCVAAYGNKVLQTPHLDKLAQSGCLFTQSFITAFPCSPSRASQLSGRYAHHHGVMTNNVLLDEKVPCLGDIAKSAGYDTAYFGKWHLGGSMYRGDTVNPKKRQDAGQWFLRRVDSPGCFKFKSVGGGGGEDEPQHDFDTWAGGWKDYHAYLRDVGWGQLLNGDRWIGNHNDAPSGSEGQHIFSQIPEEHHVESFLAKQAERYIRQRSQTKQPWAAVLSFYGPHLPVAPPKPWDTMYSLDQVTLPANHRDTLHDKPLAQRNNRTCYVLDSWSDGQFKDYIRRYWGYCSYIDKQIGRVLTALRETNQMDNTIILFTSDHGDMLTAHGMIFKLNYCGYEELYRVPAILYIPGTTTPGAKKDALISSIDFLPTLLEASGMPVPAEVDGKSLLPLLTGQANKNRDFIIAQDFGSSIIYRDNRYKFVMRSSNPREPDELYDLQNDPGELTNLAYQARHQVLTEQLRQRVLQWARDTHHPCAASFTR